MIIRYEITNTGYFFSLKLEDNVLILKQFSQQPKLDEMIEIIPTTDEWLHFASELSELDIWNWYEEYQVKCSDSCVEGDEWMVKIDWDDDTIDSHGSNSYPPMFREFIKSIEGLTGTLIEFVHKD